jgi:prophage antirepressor-like protein
VFPIEVRLHFWTLNYNFVASMKIETIEHSEFGSLMRIESLKHKGKFVFIGKTVSEKLGHTNLTQAIKSCELEQEKDYVVFYKKTNSSLFSELLKAGNFGNGNGISKIILLYESGVWKLAINSRLERGKELRNWLASEVLPSIRETGKYEIGISITPSELMEQRNLTTQRKNSKEVNTLNYEAGGVEAVIDYNRQNCFQVTGFYPHEWKQAAKAKGFSSKVYASAKEVLRVVKPELAATMSMNDYLVRAHGAKIEDLKDLDAKLPAVFEELTKLGIKLVDTTDEDKN